MTHTRMVCSISWKGTKTKTMAIWQKWRVVGWIGEDHYCRVHSPWREMSFGRRGVDIRYLAVFGIHYGQLAVRIMRMLMTMGYGNINVTSNICSVDYLLQLLHHTIFHSIKYEESNQRSLANCHTVTVSRWWCKNGKRWQNGGSNIDGQ